MNASIQDTNYLGHDIKRGDCVVGRKILSKKLGITEMGIRVSLEHLKTTNEITIKTTNKFSIITVCKWEEYQTEEKKQPAKQPAKQPTSNQQVTTLEEDKEYKKNIIEEFFSLKSDWNNIPPIGLAKKCMPKVLKDTPDLLAIWEKRRKEYTLEEIKLSINKYCDHIVKLPIDQKGYYTHRFTLFEFLQQKNGLQTFINK